MADILTENNDWTSMKMKGGVCANKGGCPKQVEIWIIKQMAFGKNSALISVQDYLK